MAAVSLTTPSHDTQGTCSRRDHRFGAATFFRHRLSSPVAEPPARREHCAYAAF